MSRRLSALVVAHNEAAQLADCLERLRFADEIVVVLDRCTDDSAEIARRFTSHVIEGAWPIEGDRRNTGIDACAGDWILEVDADERIPPPLAAEIRMVVNNSQADRHRIPVDNYVGRKLVRWGWGASFGRGSVASLFRKGAKRWGLQRVHPKLAFMGTEGVLTAVKLYPAHATTNSAHGVGDVKSVYRVLERMEKIGLPLLIHGEVTDAAVDMFDREATFIDRVLAPLAKDLPGLKIVFEHVTTKEAVEFVQGGRPNLGATITPQHLMYSRNALFVGGIRPHFYCLPILKREIHRQALRKAATSGDARFFLGTDSAPHLQHLKENACGCAGCFSAATALEMYVGVFDEEGALDKFEAFASLNGPAFYGLPPNEEKITLTREGTEVRGALVVGDETLLPFESGTTLPWRLL